MIGVIDDWRSMQHANGLLLLPPSLSKSERQLRGICRSCTSLQIEPLHVIQPRLLLTHHASHVHYMSFSTRAMCKPGSQDCSAFGRLRWLPSQQLHASYLATALFTAVCWHLAIHQLHGQAEPVPFFSPTSVTCAADSAFCACMHGQPPCTDCTRIHLRLLDSKQLPCLSTVHHCKTAHDATPCSSCRHTAYMPWARTLTGRVPLQATALCCALQATAHLTT